MAHINLDVPYAEIDGSKKTYTKLEKAVLAVSAVALVGLVGAVCLGAFSTPQLAAPMMMSRTSVGPNVMSARMVSRSMNQVAVQARAQQVASNLAELKKSSSDGRLGKIVLLGVPVLAWVGFNILGPAQNQLDGMTDSKKKPAGKATRRRGVSFSLN
uniref:Uncharacterized protein n=1 Tax=Lotharella globosa TaxID=91324 RepID=A0A7S3Z0Z2_9EUKA